MNALPTFIASLCRNPGRIGSIAPSSTSLANSIASLVDPNSRAVLDIGSGTGSVTRALLERGVAAHRLYAVELDPCLAEYLRREFPQINVFCGDAARLSEYLPRGLFGEVTTVVSSLPLLNMHPIDRMQTVSTLIDSLEPAGQFIQYTYGLNCPLAVRGLNLKAERLNRIWNNLPPATVWRFRRSN